VLFSTQAACDPKRSGFLTVEGDAKQLNAQPPKLMERHTSQKFWGTFLETDVPKGTEQVCFSKNTKLMKSTLRLCSMLDEVSFWVTKK